MLLYLIRHAEALSDSEDAKRPLSPAGMKDAERMAAFFARANLERPAEIRHSTKLRTRQTAAYFGRVWSAVPMREVAGIEPLDDVEPVARELDDMGQGLALVGHLPFLPRLAALLLTGDAEHDLIDLPPGGALCLVRTDSAQRSWSVRWMLTPRLLS